MNDDLLDSAPSPDSPAGLYVYADASEFFTAELRPVIERRLGAPRGVAWCPQWHEHPEAVARLTTVWMAWEEIAGQPGAAMSMWWLRHLDQHLAVLFDTERGPFWQCTDGHQTVRPLPHF